MTSGARGVNAPDVTPLDAARITLALLSTDKPSRAVEMVRRVGGLTFNRTYPQTPDDLAGREHAERAEDFLAELFGGGPAVSRCNGLAVNSTLFQMIVDLHSEFGGLAKGMVFDGSADDVESVVACRDAWGIQQVRRLPALALIEVGVGVARA